jgi:RNA 2',3'-cyclic 3'-phosphodiesterase
MRIFVAAFPSPEAQQAAFGVIGRLRRAGDGVSWVRRESLHYTLRFMGELEEDALTRVIEAASEAAGGLAPFAARLGGLGAYPDARHARVLWLGLSEGADLLVALAQALERALVARGFAAAERPFSPHLTLGRPRRGGEDWSARLAAGAVEAEPGHSFTVDRVRVVHSTLSPGGSIYRVRAEAALGAAAGA